MPAPSDFGLFPSRRPLALRSRVQRLGRRIAAVAVFVAAATLGGAKSPPAWDPISPADLAATASPTGASAEILFSRAHVLEDIHGTEADYYLRAKLYTLAGIDQAHLLHIRYGSQTDLSHLVARVVHPSGEIVELSKVDFHVSVIEKDKVSGKTRQIAFAFPNLAPGDIVEYRWHESDEGWPEGWFYCQSEIPVREFTYAMQTDNGAVITCQNCPQAEAKGAGTDTPSVTIRHLPPYSPEPFMPPMRDVRAWMQIVHTDLNFDDEWADFGNVVARNFFVKTMPDSAIEKLAAGLVAGAATPEEKLRRIYDYCQTKVANNQWSDSPSIRAHASESTYAMSMIMYNRMFRFETDLSASAAYTLKSGHGGHHSINHLFASLARAAGFEVRLARNSARDQQLKVKFRNNLNALQQQTVAVRLGGQWKFYDPGSCLLPFGAISWRNQRALAYVVSAKDCFWVALPSAATDDSTEQRTGRFALDADGALHGEVTLAFHGQRAEEIKEASLDTAEADLAPAAVEEVTRRLPAAEVSDVRWENLRSRDLSPFLHYHVRVPAYAQRLGQRLVWNIDFFTAGTTAAFTAEQRRYPIAFTYPLTEHDDVEVVLPPGFQLDQPSAPPNVGRPTDPFEAVYKLRYAGARRTVIYERTFTRGRSDALIVDASQYAAVKHIFDLIHRSDLHSLVLQPAAPTPAAPRVSTVP